MTAFFDTARDQIRSADNIPDATASDQIFIQLTGALVNALEGHATTIAAALAGDDELLTATAGHLHHTPPEAFTAKLDKLIQRIREENQP